MWHNAIEEDLKTIFGIKKILFGSPAFLKEQDVLFCETLSVINKIQQGKVVARVSGKVSIIGLLDKNQSGFLSKRIDLTPAAITNKFVFLREEEPVQMVGYEERFNVYSIGFIYFFKEQYNPPAGKITAVESWIVKTINFIRSKLNG